MAVVQKGDLKGRTEALICSEQEQALTNNYMKVHIGKISKSSVCGEKSVSHLTSESQQVNPTPL